MLIDLLQNKYLLRSARCPCCIDIIARHAHFQLRRKASRCLQRTFPLLDELRGAFSILYQTTVGGLQVIRLQNRGELRSPRARTPAAVQFAMANSAVKSEITKT